jgi:NAD(P)-dependent dehydrogenase (short-subunit alcohol dehydrogenase family)
LPWSPGAAQDWGWPLPRSFRRNGIRTIIVGRELAKLRAAEDALGDNIWVEQADLNSLAGIPALVKRIIDKFGQIDILVNNAGINMKKELMQVTDEEFQSVITTNLCSVFALSREVVRFMLLKGSGSIINISSMAAQYGLPYVIAYSASKTAIDGLTRAMAVELSPKGIRVNAIAPGFFITPMTDKALNSDPERMARVLARTPMGKMGETADVGEAAYFLAGESGRFITGVVLPVDGGNSIGF